MLSRAFGALALLVLLIIPAGAQTLELVESFPQGTDFDQPDIRDTREVWLEMLGAARHKIRWATFYLAHRPGQSTEPVLAAVREAADRGVKVELLVDPKFVETYPEPLNSLNRHRNIEVRTSPVGGWYGGVMHAKMMLVDEQLGFVGSQNFDWRSLQHIRELGVMFRDSGLVEFYGGHFDWEWEHYRELKPPSRPPEIEGEASIPGVWATASPNALNADQSRNDEFQIVRLLDGARREAKFALLSYSPTTHDGKHFYPVLDNAVRSAAVRGVKVKVLVSHWMEEKDTLQHLLSLNELDNVEVRAVRIPLSKEGEIPFARVHHSKYLVVDGEKGWLGTSNWSEGYFHESRNFGMVFNEAPIPRRLRELFLFDWQRATKLEKKS